MGGPAGVPVMGGGAADVIAGALDESAAAEAGAEITGSDRCGLGSLMSLTPSTLELSGLISRTPLPMASVLDGSDLAESESGFGVTGLVESVAADSDLETSRDVLSSFAVLSGVTCSVLGGSSGTATGLPRRPCFCRPGGLLSVAACTGACPSADGATRGRPYRLPSRP